MTKSKDMHYINIGVKIAETVEPVASAKIAALLVHKNEVIGVGYCNDKSHPFQKRFGKNSDSIFFHAEIHAIHHALNHYSEEELQNMKTTLYVCRVKYPPERGEYRLGLSRPCKGCTRAIEHFKINRVVYTIDSEIPGEIVYSDDF